MPKCKNCHNRIDHFNKDRCPICGVELPFEGVSSDTIEITTNIDVDNVDRSYYKPCRKKTLFILFSLLGVFGIPFFYMKKNKEGVLNLIINLLLASLMAFLLAYFTSLNVAFSILITVISFYVLNFIYGLVYINRPNLKDGNGEFII